MGLIERIGRKIPGQRELEELYDLGRIESGRTPGGYWRDSTLNRICYVSIGRDVVKRQERLRKRMAEDTTRRGSRPEKSWGWYSKYVSKDGTIHVMLDRQGNPTTSYPHIHIIHDEPGGEIRVVLSRGPKDHPEKITLPGSASAGELDKAVAKLRAKL